MVDFEFDDTEEYYSALDGDNEEEYDYADGSVVECSNCNHSWDITDSSPNDAYVCHMCGTDNGEDDSSSQFDDSVFDMDFSEIRGKNFKQSFGKVNRRIEAKPVKRRMPINPRAAAPKGAKPVGKPMARPVGRTSAKPMARPVGKPMARPLAKPMAKPMARPSGKPMSRPSDEPSFKAGARPKKPLNNNIPINKGKHNLKGDNSKKIANVIVPNDRKVIIQGASKFILSQKSKDEGIKNIGYYKGKKLKALVIIIANTDPTDFTFELFNPSMPLDYLYSTNQNLNNRIAIGGGTTSYTDMLFNILANPVQVINCQITTGGSQVANQNNQSIFVRNKSIEGVQNIFPVNVDLQIDNMQVANDIVYFNIQQAINRPFIPDGMDVIQYKVLAGMTVTMTFWYTQVSLKKFFYEDAKASKSLL
jgi:hypothetical protein